MEIKRILKLREGGFNVPVHVVNPYRKYKGEVCSTLRDYVFTPNSKVILLVETKKGTKQFPSLQVQEASLITMNMEGKGYETMVLEQPESEFFGKVRWEPDKPKGLLGVLTVDKGTGPVPHYFSYIESIPEVRLRSVARLALAVHGYLDAPGIEVDYSWSVNFVGVNRLKLIIYDYKFI